MPTRSVRGVLPEYGYTADGAGMRRGMVLVQGSSNRKAVLASALGQGKYRGIQIDEGTLPDGAANYGVDAAHPAEQINAQKNGIAWGLGAANTSPAIGDQIISSATGFCITRVPFSFSAFVLGQADESVSIGSNPQFFGVELLPQYQEVVRPVTVAQPLKTTVLGAATVYGTASGQVFPSAAVVLYVARFTGEIVRNLLVNLGIAPGGADTVTATIQKSSDQGNTWADTAVTCVISAAAVSASDLSHSAVLAKGDCLAIKLVSSAGTAAGCSASFDIT